MFTSTEMPQNLKWSHVAFTSGGQILKRLHNAEFEYW